LLDEEDESHGPVLAKGGGIPEDNDFVDLLLALGIDVGGFVVVVDVSSCDIFAADFFLVRATTPAAFELVLALRFLLVAGAPS
jgi:hypothetical protein